MSVKKKETAYFGAGCFWGVESAFAKLEGILSTEVGYMGGDEKKFRNPSYKQVCFGKTGYAETVKVEFDPLKIPYSQVLDLFWRIHDPTQLNKQGPDVGSQYRSVIFYTNQRQKKEALDSRKKMQKFLGKEKKVVTEIVKAGTFFRAEDYHQKYFEKHSGVCVF